MIAAKGLDKLSVELKRVVQTVRLRKVDLLVLEVVHRVLHESLVLVELVWRFVRHKNQCRRDSAPQPRRSRLLAVEIWSFPVHHLQLDLVHKLSSPDSAHAVVAVGVCDVPHGDQAPDGLLRHLELAGKLAAYREAPGDRAPVGSPLVRALVVCRADS